MLFRFGQRGPALTVYMRLWPVLGPIRRERDYFRDLGWQASTAKEMRVFGLVDWAIGRFRSRADESLAPLGRERRRYMTYHFLWYTAIGLVIDCTVGALMVRSAALDQITLTQLALGMQAMIAAVLLGEHYHEADVSTQYGMQAAPALNEFDALVQAHSDSDVRDAAATADAAGLPQQSRTNTAAAALISSTTVDRLACGHPRTAGATPRQRLVAISAPGPEGRS